MMTEREIEQRKAELLALQADIEKQFQKLDAGLQSKLEKIEARLLEDEQRVIATITRYVETQYGIKIDIPIDTRTVN